MANNRFTIEVLDQKKFIKKNESCKEITNPVMFNAGNYPTPDGLLSNEIFGITTTERSGIYGYIDLKEKFIQPYYYKIWLKIDKNIRGYIYETSGFKIDSKGHLIKDDENGYTGLKAIISNIDKINFKDSKRDIFLNTLLDGKKKGMLFTDKFIVVPPYYRDVATGSSGNVGVGEINKLYVHLMNSVKSLESSNDYGLDMAGGIRGRIQDTMVEIYNWFTVGESIVGGEHTGSGIFKKMGNMRRAVMSKTTDYSARLVLSAPSTNANNKKNLMVNMDYSAIPLSAACVITYPFMINKLRAFFDNEFGGKIHYTYHPTPDKSIEVELDDPQIAFSDERFDEELNEFIHGYSNRFKPIMIPNKQNHKIYLHFKYNKLTEEQYVKGERETGNIIDRRITWMDLFYRCACDILEDKNIMITRYPMDSYFNQLYTKARVYSTVETQPVVIDNKVYPWYPKLEDNEIGSNTSNKFKDTCSIANPYCALMGADYDGDQITVKMVFSVEANEELNKYRQSNAQYIELSGVNGRTSGHEAVQCMYNLTMTLPDEEKLMTDATF